MALAFGGAGRCERQLDSARAEYAQAGSGNFWIGFQATHGHDYYSNQVTLR
jgi:hypothetical protein